MYHLKHSFLFCLMLFYIPYLASAEPVLVNTVDIREGGNGKRMLLGDVTGDGRLEMVMMQPNYMDDDRYIGHEVNCLTVYTVDGDIVWQKGDPSRGGSAGSDIPAQIYDIDQDGFNEVLACMDGKFRVFDGTTGEEEYSFSYPDRDAHDCIIIANLSGNPKPQDIILKDRYNQIWAMDKDGNQLWTYRGNPGHYPWPFDFDDDGREEIICGFDYLEDDGEKVWSMNQSGHADCIWVGDIDQNPDNGTEIAVGGDDVTVYHQDGSLMWRNNQPVEPQNIAIGDFLPDQPGLEIGGQDRRDRGSPGEEAIFVIGNSGGMQYYETRSGWASIAYMCHNWDGQESDHLMLWRSPHAPALYNGNVEQVASFNDGYMMSGDINGDGVDEVITFTEENAYIYANGNADLSEADPECPAPRPQQKRHYNFTRYWGGEYTKQNFTIPTNTSVNHFNEKSKPMKTNGIPIVIYDGTNATITLKTHDKSSAPLSVELYTTQGRSVSKGVLVNGNRYVLDMGNYGRGVYVLKMKYDDVVTARTVSVR